MHEATTPERRKPFYAMHLIKRMEKNVVVYRRGGNVMIDVAVSGTLL